MGQDPDRIREEIERTRREYSASDEADRLRSEIDETRAEMGETLQALGHKADVRTRVKENVSEKKDALTSSISNAATAVTQRADAVVSSVTGVVPDKETARSGAETVKSGAQRVGISRENPLGVAVAGAAVGFVVGTLLPSTRVEDERMGEVADQVKDKAREAGSEVVERGKEVAQDALARDARRRAAMMRAARIVPASTTEDGTGMAEFDMSLVQCGARLRRSPFYEAEQRYGPKGYTVYNHMLFPIRFDDLEAEYWHLLNHVTLWDVAVERCLEIAGPDGFRFTQLLTPRNLAECAVGQAKYVLVTAPDGGILNDPVLTRMDENRFWLALASSDVLLYAKGLAARAGMDVSIEEVDVSPLQIQGPKSKDVVRDLFGDEILELKYYFFVETEVAGIPVVVTRTGWTSEIGYEVYLRDAARGTDLWELIMAAGEPYDIRPTGPSDIRRVEGGIFNWGADMTYENNPFELGLDRLVDLEVECVARDALRRIEERGVSRRLVGVDIDGDRLPALNFTKWPITVRGERVGKVTSAVYSPRLERNIGYAWVPVQLSELGSRLDVESEWGRRTGTVVPMPFWDPEKQIPAA